MFRLINRFLKPTAAERKVSIQSNAFIPTYDIFKFASFSEDDRVKNIVFIGEKGLLDGVPLMIWVFEHESSQSVVFSALKRVQNFPDKRQFVKWLQVVSDRFSSQSLEPYFTFALFKLGEITEDEMKSRLNHEK